MASSQRLKVSWKKEMPSLIRFMLCLTSNSSEIKNPKISCSKAHRSLKHLAVFVPQPVAQATWRQIIRTCMFQRRRPHDHLKDTTTLLSVKEFILLPLFEASLSNYNSVGRNETVQIPQSLHQWIHFRNEYPM